MGLTEKESKSMVTVPTARLWQNIPLSVVVASIRIHLFVDFLARFTSNNI